MPTIGDIKDQKPSESEVTTVSDDAKALGAKAKQASVEIDSWIAKIQTVSKDVVTGATDLESVGTALQSFQWIPGLGIALHAVGGALIAAGKVVTGIADLASEDAKQIANALEEAGAVLSKANGVLTSFAEDLVRAEQEWNAAGEKFEEAKAAAEKGIEDIVHAAEQEVEHIVDEVEKLAHEVGEEAVSLWNGFLSLFGDAHKNHAQKAKALDAKAKQAADQLAVHAAKVSDVATKIQSAIPTPPARGPAAAPAS